MRLIDADALPREEFQIVDEWHMHKNVGVVFAEDIDRAPTVDDVAPVRHGRWALDTAHTEEIYAHPVKCSVCGRTEVLGYETLTPYCPNCGAKMDEEVD